MKVEKIKEIRTLVTEAKIELALEQLCAGLEAADKEEYLQSVRLMQAEYFQNKSDQIKGILSMDDIRLVNNRLNDNVLEVLRELENGEPMQKKRFSMPTIQPWRYYLVGGVVAAGLLAFAWNFYKNKGGDTCPEFGRKSEFKVMVLPFLQTGETTAQRPEYDIMDRLNDLAEKSQLKAETDVREGFDISADYPSPTKAADLARGCQSDMIVWGRVVQSTGSKTRLKVRYKVVHGHNRHSAMDTTGISSLLIMQVDGDLEEDADMISKQLFAVIGNAMNKPQIALAAMSDYKMESDNMDNPSSGEPMRLDSAGVGGVRTNSESRKINVDTTLAMMKAQSLWMAEDFDGAIKEYDKVISVNPASKDALQNRGLLYFQKAEYSEAARDLESALMNPTDADAAAMRLQTEAYLHTNQLEKADNTIKKIKKMSKNPEPSAAWFKKTEDKLVEKRKLAEVDRSKAESLAQRRKSTSTRLTAAQLNLDLGSNSNASTLATKVLAKEPSNLKAVKIKVEAELAVGDTIAARKTLNSALKSGIQAREVIDWKPQVAPLLNPSISTEKKN